MGVCDCVCKYECVSMSVCLCVCVRVYACVFTCVCVRACLCGCMCVCMGSCVCVILHTLFRISVIQSDSRQQASHHTLSDQQDVTVSLQYPTFGGDKHHILTG
jgi:hypothetical protein